MATATGATAGQGGNRSVLPIAALLVGQAMALGFTLANLIIPGSAIFLSTYGSARLPYAYLIVAVVGSLVSMLVNRLQGRFGLHLLGIGVALIIAGLTVLSWRLFVGSEQRWAGYLVLTLFSVHLQMGFVFIGAQAGRAFDVQQIKRTFPRIVSGFVFGFMIGGFLADPLQNAFGRPEHLLLVAVAGAAATALLLLAASRLMASRASSEETNKPGASADGDRVAERPPPLRALLTIPLVSSVFAYQVLSAVGTQLVDYLVYDRAIARYASTEEFTAFMGSFTAILNFTGLLVLVLFGSVVMARYGLRFGVGANPLVVTGLLVFAVGASLLMGVDSTTLFVLVAIARISDITLADLATRTSVNATFQVLPPNQRLAAQVGVEGAGVPLALGLTAVMILTVNAIFDSPTVPVLVMTVVVCIAWCWLSFVVFGRYRAGTVTAARRRMLDDVHVDLAEPATHAALVDLGRSDSAGDVGAAIELLASAESDSVDGLLQEAAAHPDPTIGHAVLHHLVSRNPATAVKVAVRSIASADRRLVVDGVRTLGQLGGPEAAKHLPALLGHEDGEIRSVALAATIASSSSDDRSGRDILDRYVGAEASEERVLAAKAIGELGATEDADQLLELMIDRDQEVRTAAAVAIGGLPDAGQNTLFLQLVDVGDGRAIGEFLRQCAGRAGPDTCASVAGWLSTADPRLAHRAVRFLVANGHRLAQGDPMLTAAIVAQTDRAAAAANWASELVGTDQTAKQDELVRLRRAIAAERAQAQRHLLDVLALGYDSDLMGRVGHLWSDRVDGDHAMAREALDLTLAENHRSLVHAALADRELDESETCSFDAAASMARETSWAAEPDWLQACAVSLSDQTFDDLASAGPVTDEVLAARR